MLIDVQSANVPKYLNPNKEKLKSKGIDSVISRIMNLKDVKPDLNHEKFCQAIEDQYRLLYKDYEIEKLILDETELNKN